MFGGMAPWAQPGYAMWIKISCFHEGGSSVLSVIRIRSAVLMHESMGIQTRQTFFRIGVGASKFLGVQRIFAQIFPNLPKKLSSNFCGPFFGVASKKMAFTCFLQTLGAILAQTFRDFA